MQSATLERKIRTLWRDCHAYFQVNALELRDENWLILHRMTLLYLGALVAYLLIVCRLQQVPRQTRAVSFAILVQVVYSIVIWLYRKAPSPRVCTLFLSIFGAVIMSLVIYLGVFAFPFLPAVYLPLLLTLMTQVYTMPPVHALGLVGVSAAIFLALSSLYKAPDLFLSDLISTLIAIAIATVSYLTLMNYKLKVYHTHCELRQLCAMDLMTGVLNKTAFIREFQESLHHRTESNSYALAIIDLDRFKQINDFYGHQVGDQILCGFSSLLQERLSHTGVLIGRYGGDEFTLFFPQAEDASLRSQLLNYLEQISRVLQRQHHIPLTCSAGAVLAQDTNQAFDQLFIQADQALYAAKNQPGNAVRLARAVSSAAGSVPLVLVVTPSATDRTMLRSCLQDAYRVMEAADTPSALELIQRYHSHLSVVLLDQSLADKTEAVLTYLYETLTAQSIPMLLLGKPDCNVGAVSPADGIITRPLLPETLRQQVAQAIRQNRRSDPEK